MEGIPPHNQNLESSNGNFSPNMFLTSPYINGFPMVDQSLPPEFVGSDYFLATPSMITEPMVLDPRITRTFPPRRGNRSWKKGKKKKRPEEKVDLEDISSWPTLEEAVKTEPKEKDSKDKEVKEKEVKEKETNVNESNTNDESEQKEQGKKKGVNWVPMKDLVPTPSQYSSSRGRGRRREGKWRSGYRGRRGNRSYPRTYSYETVYPEEFNQAPAFFPIPIDEEMLKKTLLKQIEYYFSVENLCKDIFLRRQMDEEGWIPLSVIFNFNRVRALTTNYSLVSKVVQFSEIIEYHQDSVRKKGDWKTWILPKTESSSKIENKEGQASSTKTNVIQNTSFQSKIQPSTKSSLNGNTSHQSSVENKKENVERQLPKTNHQSDWVDKVKQPPKIIQKVEQKNLRPSTNGSVSSGTKKESENQGEWITAIRNKRKSGKNKKPETDRNSRAEKFVNGFDQKKNRNQNEFQHVDDNIASRIIILVQNGTNENVDQISLSTLNDGVVFLERQVLQSCSDPLPEKKSSRIFQSNSSLMGWILTHTNGKELKEIPSFEHPASKLLCDEFIPTPFSTFRTKCLEERKKASSSNMDQLYSFWTSFLTSYFNKKMYLEFKQLAIEDANENHRINGLHYLFDFYSKILQRNFRSDLFEDFQDLVLKSYEKGNNQGLNVFKQFVDQKTIAKKQIKLKPELDSLLTKQNKEEKENLNGKKNSENFEENKQPTKNEKQNPWFQRRPF